MNPETISKLVESLKSQESFVPSLYKCPTGHWTIGYGHNCDAHKDIAKFKDRTVMRDEATNLLLSDLSDSIYDCTKSIKNFLNLSDSQQAILANMCFNMGISKLLTFKKMLAAFALDDHKTIAKEMLNSLWSFQVGRRSAELIYLNFTGEFL
jgi:lysozyme